jgi:hypothetical protein
MEVYEVTTGNFSIGQYEMIPPVPISASSERARVEESSEDEMDTSQIRDEYIDTVIRHQDLTAQMTCKANPTLTAATFSLEGMCGQIDKCITCAGMEASPIKRRWCLALSEIVREFYHMNIGIEKPTTVAGQIEFMANKMADIKLERKKLAEIGAYRITRKDASDILKGGGSMVGYEVMMMKSKDSANFYGRGYVMYQKMKEEELAAALDSFNIEMRTRLLTNKHKADIVECLMALGIIYQRSGSVEVQLEGIMPMVDAMENMIRDCLAVKRIKMEKAVIEGRRASRAKKGENTFRRLVAAKNHSQKQVDNKLAEIISRLEEEKAKRKTYSDQEMPSSSSKAGCTWEQTDDMNQERQSRGGSGSFQMADK